MPIYQTYTYEFCFFFLFPHSDALFLAYRSASRTFLDYCDDAGSIAEVCLRFPSFLRLTLGPGMCTRENLEKTLKST